MAWNTFPSPEPEYEPGESASRRQGLTLSPSASGIYISDNKRLARIDYGLLKHGDRGSLATFFLQLESFTEEGFALTYRVLSKAPGEVERKQLHIVPKVVSVVFDPPSFDLEEIFEPLPDD